MRGWAGELRSLPALARHLLAASAIRSLGTGLILPLLVVYLTRANHFDLRVATTALAFVATGALLGNPLSGWLSDRAGRGPAMVASLLTSAAGVAGYAATAAPWHALASAVALGVGIGGGSTWNAVLAEAVPPSRRSFVFGANYALNNVALGVGGILGGLLADPAHPLTFRLLYTADALALLLVAVIVARAVPGRGRQTLAGDAASGPGDRLVTVLRSPAFVLLLAIGFLVSAVGYSQIESGLVASLLITTSLDTRAFGIVFAVNTLAVVVSQAALSARWGRAAPERLLRPVALVWVLTWLLVLAATRMPGYSAPLVVACAGGAVFAVGESLYAMSMPTLVNALTADRTRGRVNAAHGLATSIGFIIGPLAAGAMLGARAVTPFVLAVVAGCLVTGVLATLVRSPRPVGLALPAAEEVGR